jgi:hypothetical protein
LGAIYSFIVQRISRAKIQATDSKLLGRISHRTATKPWSPNRGGKFLEQRMVEEQESAAYS